MVGELKIGALLGFCLLLAGFALLAVDSGGAVGGQWFLQSLLLWALVWQQTWQRRDFNRFSPDAALYPDLGLANRLTLLRGLLIAATGGFLLLPPVSGWVPWIPAVLYSAAAILDRLDGFVARRTGRISQLGSQLDTVFDALGLLLAPLLALSYGRVHWTYLLVSFAYYLFVLGLYWRRRHNLPVYPLAPSKLRRTLAGFQMGYVAVVLWPPFTAQITVLAGFAFMLPLLLGFTVDWLVVSGRIRPGSPVTMTLFPRLNRFSETLLQPALRLIALVAITVVIRDTGLNSGAILLLPGALLLFGLLGRVAAAAVLMLLAWQSPGEAISLAVTVLIFTATGILLLGCGRYSLWQWDDRWVNRQDGE